MLACQDARTVSVTRAKITSASPALSRKRPAAPTRFDLFASRPAGLAAGHGEIAVLERHARHRDRVIGRAESLRVFHRSRLIVLRLACFES
jgi:hypothetical protein